MWCWTWSSLSHTSAPQYTTLFLYTSLWGLCIFRHIFLFARRNLLGATTLSSVLDNLYMYKANCWFLLIFNSFMSYSACRAATCTSGSQIFAHSLSASFCTTSKPSLTQAGPPSSMMGQYSMMGRTICVYTSICTRFATDPVDGYGSVSGKQFWINRRFICSFCQLRHWWFVYLFAVCCLCN